MEVAGLILPVFAVIVTGWAAARTRYVSRDLSDGLIYFAYNVAMLVLLVVTIAQEPGARPGVAISDRLRRGFAGLLCLGLPGARILSGGGEAAPAMQGWAASMTNTGFVALPILQATYGPRAVLPAAIATIFVAVVMFPCAVILQELDLSDARGFGVEPAKLARRVILNPMVLSTLVGVAWSVLGAPMPGPVGAYLRILADALTACALFAIGLGLSIDGVLANFGRSALLTIVKLLIMPLIVLGLSIAVNLTRSIPSQPSSAPECQRPRRSTFSRASIAGGVACRCDRLNDDVVLSRNAHLWMYALAEFAPLRSAGL